MKLAKSAFNHMVNERAAKHVVQKRIIDALTMNVYNYAYTGKYPLIS